MPEYIIENPHELEINHPRTPLSFHVSTPQIINDNSIPIVVLHGYGQHSQDEYFTNLHQSFPNQHNVIIITVNYVGTFSKTSFTTTYNYSPYEFIKYSLQIQNEENKNKMLLILKSLFEDNANVIDQLKSNNLISHSNFTPYKKTIENLFNKIKYDVCDGYHILERLDEIGFTQLPINMIKDTHNDHNDFGVIQAIDVLTAIGHIKSLKEFKKVNWSKLSILGSSHGGYVASMCDKLAPNTFNTVINNSGWIKAHKSEIFPENSLSKYKINYLTHENNYWSLDSRNQNFFDTYHEEIRDLSNKSHIKQYVEQILNVANKQLIFSHTLHDHIISLEDKTNYIETLKPYNLNIDYLKLEDESLLDGKTFKTLLHGANASYKGLILDFIINNNKTNEIINNDFEIKSKITYQCDKGTYLIDFSEQYPKITFTKTVTL